MKNEIIPFLIGIAVILNVHFVKSYPTEHEEPNETHHVESTPNNAKPSTEKLKGIAKPQLSPVGYQVSPDSGIMDHGPEELRFEKNLRQRRSSGKGQSPDLQSLLSGKWPGLQDPENFFRILNLLKQKEPPVFLDEDEYEDENDDYLNPPIDLVKGRKPYPLDVETSPKSASNAFSEPISLMSSGKNNHGFVSAFRKRSYLRRTMPLGHPMDLYYPLPYQNEKRDFTMLPNGEIALTRHGLYSLRNLLQPTPQMDDGIPVIRRPIL